MKTQIPLIAALTMPLIGCATTSSKLTYTPEVRKMSYADDGLFHDMLNAIGRVKFADEVVFPNAKQRRIAGIEAIVPTTIAGLASNVGQFSMMEKTVVHTW